MTRYLILAFITINLFSCNENLKTKSATIDNSFLFDGVIRGMDSGWIFIAHHDTTGKSYSYMDSSRIIKDSFSFSGTINEPDPCVFVFKNDENSIHFTSYFILDKGHTTGIIYKDSMEKSIITGTPTQEQYRKFNTAYIELRDEYYNIQNLLAKNPDDSSFLNRLVLVKNNQIDLIYNSIKSNPNSIVSAYIADKYLPLDIESEKIQEIYNSIQCKNNYYSKNVLKSIIVKQQTAIGQIAPDFNFLDNQNVKISNTTFANKFFLIDFWASWCIPCRAENPYLLKAYNLFHSKGFDIISISLDENKLQWEKAVKQDKLPWRQTCDTKSINSPVVMSFGITTIPMNYLIDKNGKIIGKNYRGNKLLIELENYLKE